MAELPPISLDGVHTYPLKNRLSKVRMDDFGSAWKSGGSFADWLESLPGILAADDFSAITASMVRAAGSGKMIILAMGAHPIKVGLTPIIIDLMERGIIRGIAMNGAGVIHDTEIALVGSTSEDVGAVLEDGKFGMAEETGSLINRAISAANASLYALTTAIVCAMGYLPQLGFIHEDPSISFVLDIADLFRDTLTLPVAFGAVRECTEGQAGPIERVVRRLSGRTIHKNRVIPGMIDRIKELFCADDRGGDA